MSELLDLAAKVEALTEPSRETDAEIAIALGHKIQMVQANYTMEMFPAIHWHCPHPYAGMKEPCPAWTASLDAAMTLVPEGWWIEEFSDCVSGDNEGVKIIGAHCSLDAYFACGFAGDAPTRALALTAAALRARAALSTTERGA